MDNLPFFTRSKGRKPDPAAKPPAPGGGLRTHVSSNAFRKAPAPAAMPSTQPQSDLHRGIDAHARRKQQLGKNKQVNFLFSLLSLIGSLIVIISHAEREIQEIAWQTKEVDQVVLLMSSLLNKAAA